MGFVWSSLNVGDIIAYSASVQIDEMRDNLDWLDNNVANRTNNATVNGTNNTTDFGANNAKV